MAFFGKRSSLAGNWTVAFAIWLDALATGDPKAPAGHTATPCAASRSGPS